MKRQIKIALYVIMAISLVACAFVGVRRIQVENNYKEIELAVRYNDIYRIAHDTDRTYEEVLIELKEAGATTLLVRENVVASASDSDYYTFKGKGELALIEGYILKFSYPDNTEIRPDTRYIVSENREVVSQIYDAYKVKGIELDYVVAEGTYFLEVGDHSSDLSVMGVGFDTEALNIAASLGYSISPQIKNWKDITPESVDYLIEQLNAIDNLGTIYFADSEIPGASTQELIDYMTTQQLGFIEFTSNKQKGFETLAKAMSDSGTNYNVVRLHTLGDSQVATFTISALMDRYSLALRERDIRVFLFKMPSTTHVEDDMTYLKTALTTFGEFATGQGYTPTNQINAYNLPVISVIIAILVGLASIVIFVLLLSEMGFTTLGYVLGIIGVLGYIGLLKLKPVFASQMIALFGSVMFPTYAVYKAMSSKPQSLLQTVISFLKVCLISFGGVLTIIGALSRTSFGIGIDLFAGVKVATFAPIVLVVILLVYEKHKLDLKYYKGLLDRKISYGSLIIIAVLAGVLVIYVTRTGNNGTVSAAELQFRQFLDNVLGVRPRTKEFLITYPILMALLYFGYKEAYIIFVALAAIGPASLVNTYAHIHTPILISLLRSVYGIILGIIIGLILIGILKLLGRAMKKWQTQLK